MIVSRVFFSVVCFYKVHVKAYILTPEYTEKILCPFVTCIELK